MSNREEHPTDQMLLRAADAELSPSDLSRTERHLQLCWQCRARSQRIKDTIVEFTSFFASDYLASLPPPPQDWRNFPFLLLRQDREIGQSSIFALLRRCFQRVRTIVLTPAVVLVVVALLGLALFLLHRGVPAVSAHEVLARAALSETNELARASKPAVYQKLLIRCGGTTTTRTIYRDVSHHRQADRWDSSAGAKMPPGPVQQIAERLQASEFDWQNPLSAESFRRWQARLDRQKAVESVDASDGVYTVLERSGMGAVSEAEIMIRQSDFHPMRERIRFRDDQEIEITELAYQVMALDGINPAIFSSEREPLPEIARVGRAPVLTGNTADVIAEIASRSSDLERSELDCRYVLRQLGADLGEQIEVLRTPSGVVQVQGLVTSAERKAEIELALKTLPQVTVTLQTLEEATAGLLAIQNAPVPLAVPPPSEAPLKSLLKSRFPDYQEREAFTSELLRLSQTVLSHTIAMSRLAGRYSSERIMLLPDESKRQLETMLVDHLEVLRIAEQALQEHIVPLLGQEADPGPSSNFPSGWQAGSDEILLETRRLDELMTKLVAGPSAGVSDSGTETRNLLEGLRRVQAEILLLIQRVRADLHGGE